MSLYSDYHYAIHSEFVHGYLAMFLACFAIISFSSSCFNCLLRPNDLGKDISSLCFRACLSVLHIHPKDVGPGGSRVVTSYASMGLGCVGSFGYDSPPRFDRRRPPVVTALSIC